MKNVWKKLVLGGFAAALLTLPTAATATAPANDQELIAQQVRHELVTLPFYSIWDNLNFKVEGTKVTLMGEVQRPSMKTSAERVAIRVPGVTEVENQIEVLPLSNFDNRIRIAVARAIFGNPVLSQYALRSVSPIHIIVKNGDVRLEGVVLREMDRNIAYLQANGVPGVFSVTNNLRVELPSREADQS
jgi:hyperosmotically inducible protein